MPDATQDNEISADDISGGIMFLRRRHNTAWHKAILHRIFRTDALEKQFMTARDLSALSI